MHTHGRAGGLPRPLDCAGRRGPVGRAMQGVVDNQVDPGDDGQQRERREEPTRAATLTRSVRHPAPIIPTDPGASPGAAAAVTPPAPTRARAAAPPRAGPRPRGRRRRARTRTTMPREADTRPPAGPGANAGASSSTRPPWAPIPGAGTARVASSSRSRSRWPARSRRRRRRRRRCPPGRPRPEAADERREPVADRPAAGELELLDVSGPGVRGAHEHEQTAARGRAASSIACERVAALAVG